MTHETWGVRPNGTRPRDLDRTPEQLTRIRDTTMPLWTVAFDFYTSPQLGYTTAVGDLAKLTGLDNLYVHSLVTWVMSANHPDVVDLFENDTPET